MGVAHWPTEEFEERAALIEYSAGVPRDWAEGLARLDPSRPPHGVSLARWHEFIDDVGRFLDAGWARRATALGWGPNDLFRCDPRCPATRKDTAGLLWLLGGGELVALTATSAAVRLPNGAVQTYRRKPQQRGAALLWDLLQDEKPKSK
jgi:hypothetical protein